MGLLRLKMILVGGTLVSLLMGGIFVFCHSLINNNTGYTGHPSVLSETEMVSEQCCEVQVNNHDLYPLSLVTIVPVSFTLDNIPRVISNPLPLPPAGRDEVQENQRLYLDSHPEMSLYSYLTFFITQGLLHPQIYEWSQASV
ncbi:MAG: hypothetical protein HY974_00140 [Candidatus Kerfeldbacteria bacterium]|nr:hypothetical protein [Candidatus Kerfeldbacteria bacterium]